MHQPREEEHRGGRSPLFGADSHNRAPGPSNDELRFLRADDEEAKNGLLDAREMAESARDRAAAATEAAERTRREHQGLVERLRQLETAAFGGLSRTRLHALGLALTQSSSASSSRGVGLLTGTEERGRFEGRSAGR